MVSKIGPDKSTKRRTRVTLFSRGCHIDDTTHVLNSVINFISYQIVNLFLANQICFQVTSISRGWSRHSPLVTFVQSPQYSYGFYHYEIKLPIGA